MPGVSVNIPVDHNVKPVQQPWRRIPLNLQDKVQAKIQDLINRGIVEPVNMYSRWQSPLVIVPKPGGDIRLCVDLRLVNKAVRPEKYPIPTIESKELLKKVVKLGFYSKTDQTLVYADASPEALGAVLVQVDKNG